MTRCHEHLQQFEHFVVLVYYHRTSTDVTVNEARNTFSLRGLINPPTQAALVEHIKRAAYSAGYVWAQMLVASVLNYHLLRSGHGRKIPAEGGR